MVEVQLRRRGIHDPRVLEAIFRVPRHQFAPSSKVDEAYEDRPIAIGDSETISQPYIVAAMTQAVNPQAGEKVLEVGTGSGYQAAILETLGTEVFTIERNPVLSESAQARLTAFGYNGVTVLLGDGSEGYPPEAPFDIILVTAAAPDITPVLTGQLSEGGRLMLPVGDLAQQSLTLAIKQGDRYLKRILDHCKFVPLIGKYGWPEKNYKVQ